MKYLHLAYDMPLYRPPSEAYSLILQLTYGCSHNHCSFCEMYKMKKFKIRREQEVFDEIEILKKYNLDVRRVFFADGNAMVLSAEKLLRVINKLNSEFTSIHRISSYALPKDILSKTDNELSALKEAGLDILYVGIESGDDELLKAVNKGETYQSTVDGLLKAKKAGIKVSVMIVNGLGGENYTFQHAYNSARIINEIQPEFLSTLSLSTPLGTDDYKSKFGNDFIPLDKFGILKELELFINYLELDNTVYRSDHASNYLILKGILNRDKHKLIKTIGQAIELPGLAILREEWQRGL